MANLLYRSKQEVEVPIKDNSFAIRTHDWKRIRRLIKDIPKEKKYLSRTYSLCFGACISAFVTIIPLIKEEIKNSWIIPLLLSGAIFALLLGLILVFIEWSLSKNKKDSIEEIKTEIQEIEKLYPCFNE